jgi:hypothetical protein
MHGSEVVISPPVAHKAMRLRAEVAATASENSMATDNGQNQDAGEVPFWRRKSLEQMTDSEWESLCDGCGRCCLNKLEEEETGRTYYTNVGCRLLDGDSCRCRDYPNRLEAVDDCVRLTPEALKTINWLPPSCAYVLLGEGKDLYWWHPLVSGDSETVHAAGVSVKGRVRATEATVPDSDLEDYIVSWPLKLSKRARQRR